MRQANRTRSTAAAALTALLLAVLPSASAVAALDARFPTAAGERAREQTKRCRRADRPQPSPSPTESADPSPSPAPSETPQDEPSPSPSPTISPLPDDLEEERDKLTRVDCKRDKKKDRNGKDGDKGGNDGAGKEKGKGDAGGRKTRGGKQDDGRDKGKGKGEKAKADKTPVRPQTGGGGVSLGSAQPTGSFSTGALVSEAQDLRAGGASAGELIDQVYRPFIIAGEASWSNTWGAPRFGPGPLIRTHEGQDVFCEYGAPVLATEPGTVEFDDGGLGGRIARLHRSDGSYWYYAHLAGWNTDEFSSGDRVDTGDVIGYCGNSGNAAGGSPHVHFGWYGSNGVAKNPMGMLVRWLHTAERRALGAITTTGATTVATGGAATAALRLLPTYTAPDPSDLRLARELMWALGSSFVTETVSLEQTMFWALDSFPALSDFALAGVSSDPGAGDFFGDEFATDPRTLESTPEDTIAGLFGAAGSLRSPSTGG